MKLTDIVVEKGSSAAEESLEAPIDTILQKVDVVGLAGLGSPDEMKRKLTENLAVYNTVVDFVNEKFIEGSDYGKAIDEPTAKPVLLLAGAEKIVHAFNTHPEWFNDKDTWEMLGKPTTTVFLVCRIVDNESHNVIGEGRGACTINEAFGKQCRRDTNGAVKIAKKRALVDAAKGTFMLSDRFTQDLDEIKSFRDVKDALYKQIQERRAQVKSDLSTNQFIRKVCEGLIKKKVIGTMNELKIIMSFWDQYDLATGEKLSE